MATDSPKNKQLAVVTGGASGTDLVLVRQFAERRFDLIIAADDAGIASNPRNRYILLVDLSTFEGVKPCTNISGVPGARWKRRP